MTISDQQAAKIDPALHDQLVKADAGDFLRTVMILNPDNERRSEPFSPDPSDYPSRQAYRQALIDQKRNAVDHELGGIKNKLREHSLVLRGGDLTNLLIVEGHARNIVEVLAWPEIRYVRLDEPLNTA